MALSSSPRRLRTRSAARRHEDAGRQSLEPAASKEIGELAGYIADMTAELAALAGRAQLSMLAYFLNLARVEAEMRSREAGGRSIERRV